jgi:hypothetical protein
MKKQMIVGKVTTLLGTHPVLKATRARKKPDHKHQWAADTLPLLRNHRTVNATRASHIAYAAVSIMVGLASPANVGFWPTAGVGERLLCTRMAVNSQSIGMKKVPSYEGALDRVHSTIHSNA